MGPLATLSLLTGPPLVGLCVLVWWLPALRSPLTDTLAVILVALALALAGWVLARREGRLRAALAAAEGQRDQQAAALAEARAELARATAARRALLTTIGHELRTPMTSIIGMTRLALSTDLTVRQRAWLQRADRAAHQLQGRLAAILDSVRAASGALMLEDRHFRLDDVLAEVSARAAAVHQGLSVGLTRDPRLPAVLFGDGRRFGQVLGALAEHALESSSVGEAMIGLRLLRRTTDGVEIECEVCGSGDPAAPGVAERERRFDACMPGEECPDPRQGDADLGLALARQLVDRMGGRLQMAGLPGGGTRALVWLPFRLGPAAVPEPARTAQLPGGATGLGVERAGMAVIDLGLARRRCGSQRRLRRRLRRFAADHGRFLADYQALRAAGDHGGAARLAQALVDAAEGLGARGLAAPASRLALLRHAGDDPSRWLEAVAAELATVIGVVTAVLNQPEPLGTRNGPRSSRRPWATVTPQVAPAPTPRLDPARAARALKELAGLLADCDGAAINSFARLRPLLRGLGPTALVEALERDLQGFDFARARLRLCEVAQAAHIDLGDQALADVLTTVCPVGQRLH